MFLYNHGNFVQYYSSRRSCQHCDDMKTKQQTKLWLLDKSPPIFHDNEPHGFEGSLPPTIEQILLQYFGYLNCVKGLLTDSRLSWCRAAAVLVVKDVEKWWERTGIAVKSSRAIEKMILRTVNEYNCLKKIPKRNG